MATLRLATFEGPLARALVARVKDRLSLFSGPPLVEPIDLGAPGLPAEDLDKLAGALLTSRAELGVYPAPFLPLRLPRGVIIAALLGHRDPNYLSVSARSPALSLLPTGSRIATCCPLARAQILYRLPWLFVQLAVSGEEIRSGLADGRWDAACVPPEIIDEVLHEGLRADSVGTESMMPRVGQGEAALLARGGEDRESLLCRSLADAALEPCWRAERTFVQLASEFPGSLATARATRDGDDIDLTGLIVDTDGGWLVLDEAKAPAGFATVAAQDLAEACKESARAESTRPPIPTKGIFRA